MPSVHSKFSPVIEEVSFDRSSGFRSIDDGRGSPTSSDGRYSPASSDGRDSPVKFVVMKALKNSQTMHNNTPKGGSRTGMGGRHGAS